MAKRIAKKNVARTSKKGTVKGAESSHACQDCSATGLRDANTLCITCSGTGKSK